MGISVKNVKMLGAITGCVVMLALTGCSADEDSPAPDPSTPEPSASPDPQALFAEASPVEPAWTGGEYILEIGIFGDVAVLVAGGEPDLLTGVDVSSGEVLWETETNRGAIESTQASFAFPVENSGGEPLLLNLTAPVLDTASNHYYHGVELLDPSTGDQVKDLGPHWVGSRWECEFDGGVCAWVLPFESGSFESEPEIAPMRLNPDTLEFEALGPVAAGAYAQLRSYLGDVYGVQTLSGEELLVRNVAGEELWRVPAADALGDGAIASGDAFAGSSVFLDEGVVTIYGQFHHLEDSPGLSETSTHVAVALDRETGDILWTRSGVIGCGPRVMCSGDLTFEQEGDTPSYSLTTGDVEVLGVDARSGEQKWSIGPMPVEGMINTVSQSGYVSTEESMFITLDGVTQVIDIETGQMWPLGSTFGACYEPVQEPRPEWSNPENDMASTTVGGRYAACNDEHDSSPEAHFTAAQVESIGMRTWQPRVQWEEELPSPRYHVVNTVGGLLGFEF